VLSMNKERIPKNVLDMKVNEKDPRETKIGIS
jgi:hypothetical protein